MDEVEIIFDSEERYVIEAILGLELYNGVAWALIAWEGYDEPTWEPAHVILQDAPETFLDYLRQVMEAWISHGVNNYIIQYQ